MKAKIHRSGAPGVVRRYISFAFDSYPASAGSLKSKRKDNYPFTSFSELSIIYRGRPFCAAFYLNNKYFIDGRDPNSYADVAWLLGLHGRPWKERPVFGKVRYMSRDGLKRKFDIEACIQTIAAFSQDQEP